MFKGFLKRMLSFKAFLRNIIFVFKLPERMPIFSSRFFLRDPYLLFKAFLRDAYLVLSRSFLRASYLVLKGCLRAAYLLCFCKGFLSFKAVWRDYSPLSLDCGSTTKMAASR